MNKKIRVTAKYLQNWVNDKFKQLEINEVECHKVVRTSFLSSQYESGACRLYIRFRRIDNVDDSGYFLCFYSMQEIQDHINSGYELFLDFTKHGRQVFSLSEAELNIRKA